MNPIQGFSQSSEHVCGEYLMFPKSQSNLPNFSSVCLKSQPPACFLGFIYLLRP